jgi:signal recognition particle subunit SEC65
LRKALKEAGIEIIKPEEVKAKPEEEEFARVLREAGIEVV